MISKIKIAVFILIIFSTNSLFNQNLKRHTINNQKRNPLYELSNEQIKLIIEEYSGKYYLKTTDNKNLLYIDSTRTDFFTSHLNIKVDDSLYSNESKLANAKTLIGKVSIDTNKASTDFDVYNNKIHITQNLYPVNYHGLGALYIEIKIKNSDIIPHNIGSLNLLDLQINRNDAVYFKTNNKDISNPIKFSKDSLPYIWRAYEKYYDETGFMVQGILKGEIKFITRDSSTLFKNLSLPDEIIFDEWEKLYWVLWDYETLTPYFSDGAILIKWNEKELPPDSTISFSAFIGVSKGTITDGNIIINCFNPQEIIYNGKKYIPDPFDYNIIIYNNSNKTINNINSILTLPWGVFADSLSKSPSPKYLLPLHSNNIHYNLHAKMSAEKRASTIKINLSSDEYSALSSSIVYIPAAPDADTLDPLISIEKINCSFRINVTEKRENDKGIDSVLVLSNDNIVYNFTKPNKGDTALEIFGSLIKPYLDGKIYYRIFDMAGNVSDVSIKIEPDIIGFDNESFNPNNQIYLPFKIKKKDLSRKDTSLYCVIEYDNNTLTPLQNPLIIPDEKINISDIYQKNNEIFFNLNCKSGLKEGTIGYLVFNSNSIYNDSTRVIIKDIVLNSNTNLCVYKNNATIKFDSKDNNAPKITMKQFGCRFYGNVSEPNPDDKGIYYMFLSDNTNSILFSDFHQPGDKITNFIISAIDSSKTMKGNLCVVDGSGNISTYYYQVEPVLIKIDTTIASSKNKISVSPYIYGELPDLDLKEYSFAVRYDTNLLYPSKPFYDMSGCSSSDYTVNIDTSQKGLVKINAFGNSFLTLGKVINLYFIFKVGKDTTSKIQFEYFYLKQGQKGVHTTDGVVIRKNLDLTPPQIKYYQLRNNFFVEISDTSYTDLGIDSIKVERNENFSYSLLNKTDKVALYTFKPLDSLKVSFCTIKAVDLLGNTSTKDLNYNPIKIILPDSIFSENDSLSFAISLKPTKDFKLNSLSFKIKIDTNFFNASDSLKITTSQSFNTNYFYDRKISSIYLNFYSNNIIDTNGVALLKINLPLQRNNKISTTVFLYDIVINNDSLFAFSNKLIATKRVTDSIKPLIKMNKFGCEYYINIFDSGGINKVWLDSLMNIKDSLIYLSDKQNDTSLIIKIIPINYKLNSRFKIYAQDSLENESSFLCEMFPIKLSLPEKTKIIENDKNLLPIIITNHNHNKINNITFKINFNNNLVRPDTNFIFSKNTISSNSKIEYKSLSNNSIYITASENFLNDSIPFLYLNFIGLTGDTLSDFISITDLSINNDTICSFSINGILYRNKLNQIYVSLQPETRAKIGNDAIIPIYINGDYKEYNFTNIKLLLSFNPTLLKPLGIISKGTALEDFNSSIHYELNGKLTLDFSGNGKLKENLPLTIFTAKTLLGDCDSTTLKIDSFKYEYTNNISQPAISFSNGLFVISNKYEWQKGLKYNKNYLYQNHPNPYNSSTMIKFSVSDRVKTQIIIYDILGREISKLVDDVIDAGEHYIVFNSNNLPSGVYYCKMKTDIYTQIIKMVLLK